VNTQSLSYRPSARVQRGVLALSWDRVALGAAYAGIAVASIDVRATVDISTATVKPSHVLFGLALACAAIGIARSSRRVELDARTKAVLIAAVVLMATQVISYLGGFPGVSDAAGRIAVMVGGAAVPLLAIVLTVNDRSRFETALAVFVCAQFAFAVFGLYQLLSDPLGLPTPVDQVGIVAGAGRISSWSLEPGYYAAYVCTSIPIVTYMLVSGRRFGPINPVLLAAVLITVLVFANSRMGYVLALATTVASLALIHRGGLSLGGVWRRVGATAAVTVLLVPLVSLGSGIWPGEVVASQVTNTVSAVKHPNSDPADCAGPDNNACTSNFVRSEVYRAGWQMFKDHPIVGVGDGRAIDELPAYGVDFFEGQGEGTLQSVLLEVGAESGIIGLAALVFLLWTLARIVLSSPRGADPEGDAWPARLLLLGAFMMVLVGGLVLMWLWDVRVWSLVGLALAGLAAAARGDEPAPVRIAGQTPAARSPEPAVR
jgi:O-antigen ligase